MASGCAKLSRALDPSCRHAALHRSSHDQRVRAGGLDRGLLAAHRRAPGPRQRSGGQHRGRTLPDGRARQRPNGAGDAASGSGRRPGGQRCAGTGHAAERALRSGVLDAAGAGGRLGRVLRFSVAQRHGNLAAVRPARPPSAGAVCYQPERGAGHRAGHAGRGPADAGLAGPGSGAAALDAGRRAAAGPELAAPAPGQPRRSGPLECPVAAGGGPAARRLCPDAGTRTAGHLVLPAAGAAEPEPERPARPGGAGRRLPARGAPPGRPTRRQVQSACGAGAGAAAAGLQLCAGRLVGAAADRLVVAARAP